MEIETQQASPEMKLFFEKLLKLKEDAKIRGLEKPDCYMGAAWQEVYERLDEIIKEKK